MPSVSRKQHNLMALVANDPKAAKRLGIPQSVGRDYVKADKGRKFAEGGDMKESKAMMKKEVAFMKKKGAPKSMIKHEEKEAKGYAMGGKIMMPPGGGKMPKNMPMGPRKGAAYAKGGSCYSSGGGVSASRRADGIAKKGKTRGMVC